MTVQDVCFVYTLVLGSVISFSLILKIVTETLTISTALVIWKV